MPRRLRGRGADPGSSGRPSELDNSLLVAVVRRYGRFVKVDVNDPVPGDVIRLALGEAVPADVKLIDVDGRECNETCPASQCLGEVTTVGHADAGLTDSNDPAFMGTIVSAGDGLEGDVCNRCEHRLAASPPAWVSGTA